jgi:hypothetical protein
MPLVITDNGMLEFVSRMVGAITTTPDWLVGLFVNNITPDRETVLGDFVEPSWPGYGRVELFTFDWQSPVIVDDRAELVYGSSPIAWANDGSIQTVFGYFVVNDLDDGIMWAEAFGTPRVMPSDAVLQLDLKQYVRNDPDPP